MDSPQLQSTCTGFLSHMSCVLMSCLFEVLELWNVSHQKNEFESEFFLWTFLRLLLLEIFLSSSSFELKVLLSAGSWFVLCMLYVYLAVIL